MLLLILGTNVLKVVQLGCICCAQMHDVSPHHCALDTIVPSNGNTSLAAFVYVWSMPIHLTSGDAMEYMKIGQRKQRHHRSCGNFLPIWMDIEMTVDLRLKMRENSINGENIILSNRMWI